MIEVLKQMVEVLESATVDCSNFHHAKKDQNHHLGECPPVIRWHHAIQAGKKAIAKLERQKPVALFYLPVRKDMREDVEALIDHAKRARWTNVVVRKDAVETTYEADWIKELIPYTPPQRTWVGLTDEEISACDPSEECWGLLKIAKAIEAKLKEKNTN
jgi:hypothetical protein